MRTVGVAYYILPGAALNSFLYMNTIPSVDFSLFPSYKLMCKHLCDASGKYY